jgi:hypothetical protein
MSDKKSGGRKLFLPILIIISCAFLFAYAQSNITPKSVHVSGYTRKDGTRVKAYNRRPPGSVAHDAPYETLRTFSGIGIFVGAIMAGAAIGEIRENYTDKKNSKYYNNLPPHKISDFIETGKQETFLKKESESLSFANRIIKPQEKEKHTEIKTQNLTIEYSDMNGKVTKRQIRIVSINGDYIRAYCFLRNEERTFKFSRIIQLTVDGVICDKKYLLDNLAVFPLSGSVLSHKT